MTDSTAARRALGPFVLFLAIFAILWLGYVVFIWKLALAPAAARPLLRSILLIGAAVAWVLWERRPRPLEWLGLWPVDLRQAAITIAIFALVFGIFFAIHHGLGRLAAQTPSSLAVSFLGVFVEELLFRGAILKELAERYRAAIAVLASSVLFLLLHVPGWLILALHPGTITTVWVFLIGIVCAILRLWSRSLWPGVAAHWANNLVQLM